MRSRLFVLPSALMAITLGACSSLSPLRKPAEVNSVDFVPGNQYEATVSSLLDGATRSIDVVQFNFSDKTGFPQKLIEIKKAHEKDPVFRIRVLVEKSRIGADKANKGALELLRQAGFADNPLEKTQFAFYQASGKTDSFGNEGITHTKLVMLDEHKILAGSTNWTFTSIKKNNETDLLVDSNSLGSKVVNYIEDMIAGPDTIQGGEFPEINLTMLTDHAFLPAAQVFLGSALKGERLDCSMYLFSVGNPKAPPGDATAEKIRDALVQSKDHGADIHLLLESSAINDFTKELIEANARAAKSLSDAGIKDILYDDPQVISHMKFCVLTHASGGYQILMGSSNWNYLDIELNHQLNWIIDDPEGHAAKPLLEYLGQARAQPGVKSAI